MHFDHFIANVLPVDVTVLYPYQPLNEPESHLPPGYARSCPRTLKGIVVVFPARTMGIRHLATLLNMAVMVRTKRKGVGTIS